jgi:hypothetical protein
MTRKDYELIAAIIAAMPRFAASLRTQHESTARQFADKLASDNPRFDRERFLTACGVQGNG